MAHREVIHPKELLAKEENRFKAFNNALASKLGNLLGSMPFFYVCVLLDLIELPPVIASHSAVLWINYIAQTVIQLIALPIISTQSNLQQKQNDAKADADHHTLTYLAEIQDEQLQILKDLKDKQS